MSSATDYGGRRHALIYIEDRMAAAIGEPLKIVRQILARSMKLPPGTLLNIRKGRLKSLRGEVERAIDAAFIEALQREIERLGHELEMAKARGVAVDRGPLAAAVASRDELIALLADAPT